MKKLSIIIAAFFLFTSCQSKENHEATDAQQVPSAETSQVAPEVVPQPVYSYMDEAAKYPPAPELPPSPDTLKIAIISDINQSYGMAGYTNNVKKAIEDIVAKKFDFVVSPGDLVAGQKQGLDYARMWKAFHYEVGDVFFDNGMEFIFAPGNHDASAYDSHANERVEFAKAFENRKPKAPLIEGSHFPFYYGVVIRDVRVIALDITRRLSNTDPQLDWLETVLKSDQKVRANLVLGHLPLSPINMGQFWEVAGSTRLLEILQKTPKTFYISGHHHIFYPGHIGELRTINAPALGNGPRSLFGAPARHGYVQLIIPPEAPPTVTALVAPDFRRMINIKSLPTRVVQAEREDVGMAEYIMEMLDANANGTSSNVDQGAKAMPNLAF